MSRTIKSTEIIESTALSCQQPLSVSNAACQVMLERISECLSWDNTVEIKGFGTFTVIGEDNQKTVQFMPSSNILNHKTLNDPADFINHWHQFHEQKKGGE